jgi:UDP-2,3-diacylglucosamine pyrophosphatase LpxH
MHTLVLSDIHLGNGAGYDIFAGEAVLPAVLDEAASSRAHVIFNGDSIDYLMNEDPLELTVPRAVAQTEAIVNNPASAAVLAALGRVLAAGGAVEIRLGNHDAELALPEVQAVLRASLGQPPEVAARLQFTRNDQPGLLDVGGARLLVTHGDHNDPWNRIDYPSYDSPRGFRYPPGSRLVKTLLNPLKRRYGMRFADLLKPDFQGAVLTALAVDPSAVSLIFQGSSARLLWQLFRRLDDDFNFAPGEQEPEQDLGLAAAIDSADLTPEERASLEAVVDPDNVSFAAGGGLLASARLKLAKTGLKYYASLQRKLAGDSGDRFFGLAPDDAEWDEARRLADKFGADAVVIGHTHAARFRAEPGLTYVNTGTWIYLMGLPAANASALEWEQFLTQCTQNPALDPSQGPAPPLITRLTGLEVDPHPQGGAVLRLVEYTAGRRDVLGETHVPAR